jgi:guanylate kinase
MAAPHAVEALRAVKTSCGEKLHEQMAYRLASAYYDLQIENRGNFENYLSTNSRLAVAVKEINCRKEAKVHTRAQHAETKLYAEEARMHSAVQVSAFPPSTKHSHSHLSL